MDRRARERDARSGAHRRLVTARRLAPLALAAGLLTVTSAPSLASARSPNVPFPPLLCSPARPSISGHEAQQDDLTVNPGCSGSRGRKALAHVAGTRAFCATCHGEPARMRGVAAHPAYDPALRALFNLEAHISGAARSTKRPRRSPTSCSNCGPSTALVAQQSRGLPISVVVDGPMRPLLGSGRSLYYQQQGQLNLSCAQCHEEAWGKRLRAERISQGHPNGFPA